MVLFLLLEEFALFLELVLEDVALGEQFLYVQLEFAHVAGVVAGGVGVVALLGLEGLVEPIRLLLEPALLQPPIPHQLLPQRLPHHPQLPHHPLHLPIPLHQLLLLLQHPQNLLSQPDILIPVTFLQLHRLHVGLFLVDYLEEGVDPFLAV